MWQSLVKVYKEDGIRGYWRGNGANCIRVIPYSATQVPCPALRAISSPTDCPLTEEKISEGRLALDLTRPSCHVPDLSLRRLTTARRLFSSRRVAVSSPSLSPSSANCPSSLLVHPSKTL